VTRATAVVLLALGLDLVVGEVPNRVHPVAWFGRSLDAIDRGWRRPRRVGAAAACLWPLAAATVAASIVGLTSSRSLAGGIVVAALCLFVTTSYRSLLATVWRVCRMASTDLPAARSALVALAGRETRELDTHEVHSAALESLAENLADGLVAPLVAFGLGGAIGPMLGFRPAWSLGLACAGAVWIKAVNTMDSMWGYPGRSLGTASARLDDLAMWLPARLTAVLVAAAFLDPGALGRAHSWVGTVPSPNAGWPMGTLAAALGVRLEKPGVYVLHPHGRDAGPLHVEPALRRLGLAGLGAYAAVGVV
jgi:adenosylcobinamide-phosphate synthase